MKLYRFFSTSLPTIDEDASILVVMDNSRTHHKRFSVGPARRGSMDVSKTMPSRWDSSLSDRGILELRLDKLGHVVVELDIEGIVVQPLLEDLERLVASRENCPEGRLPLPITDASGPRRRGMGYLLHPPDGAGHVVARPPVALDGRPNRAGTGGHPEDD